MVPLWVTFQLWSIRCVISSATLLITIILILIIIFCYRRGVFLIATFWGFFGPRIVLILQTRLTLQSLQRSHLILCPTPLALPETRLRYSSGWC